MELLPYGRPAGCFFDIGSTLVDEREGFRLRIEKPLRARAWLIRDFVRRMEEHYRQGRNGDKLAFAELGIPSPLDRRGDPLSRGQGLPHGG